MKKGTLVLLMTLGFGGCSGEPADALMNEQLSLQMDILSVLESVKDEKTADEAVPKLEKAADRLAENLKKVRESKISAEDGKKLMEKYGAKKLDIETKMAKASQGAATGAGPAKAAKITEALRRSLKGLE